MGRRSRLPGDRRRSDREPHEEPLGPPRRERQGLLRAGAGCGTGVYDDAAYVFGAHDRRPANTEFNGAGLDVSPALNGCLAFSELDGEDDLVDWQFVEVDEVPAGPWGIIVTTSGVR